jgi:uncharacterized membrane protein
VTDVLLFIILVCGSFVAGGNVFSVWAVRPAIRTLPPEHGQDVHRRVSARAEKYMPPAGALVALSGIGLLVADRDMDAAWATAAAGLALTLLNIAVAFSVDIPVTKQLGALPLENFDEAESNRLNDRWDRWNVVRGFLGIGALALFIVSALVK